MKPDKQAAKPVEILVDPFDYGVLLVIKTLVPLMSVADDKPADEVRRFHHGLASALFGAMQLDLGYEVAKNVLQSVLENMREVDSAGSTPL